MPRGAADGQARPSSGDQLSARRPLSAHGQPRDIEAAAAEMLYRPMSRFDLRAFIYLDAPTATYDAGPSRRIFSRQARGYMASGAAALGLPPALITAPRHFLCVLRSYGVTCRAKFCR